MPMRSGKIITVKYTTSTVPHKIITFDKSTIKQTPLVAKLIFEKFLQLQRKILAIALAKFTSQIMKTKGPILF